MGVLNVDGHDLVVVVQRRVEAEEGLAGRDSVLLLNLDHIPQFVNVDVVELVVQRGLLREPQVSIQHAAKRQFLPLFFFLSDVHRI